MKIKEIKTENREYCYKHDGSGTVVLCVLCVASCRLQVAGNEKRNVNLYK